MARILIGTTNQAKLEEARAVLSEDGFEILGLKDFPGPPPVEETGNTFEENALLKAQGYFAATGVPTIADDGGLMVEALGGLPGVHSHRWLGREATDRELADAVLERLKNTPMERRAARLGGVAIFTDGEHTLKEENYVIGFIADRLMSDIQPGFPYRAILMIPQFGKPYSMLTHQEHEAVNFRRKSLHALKPRIIELLS